MLLRLSLFSRDPFIEIANCTFAMPFVTVPHCRARKKPFKIILINKTKEMRVFICLNFC